MCSKNGAMKIHSPNVVTFLWFGGVLSYLHACIKLAGGDIFPANFTGNILTSPGSMRRFNVTSF